MTTKVTFDPQWVSPPGETIADVLSRRGLTFSMFVARMDRPVEVISGLLRGDVPIDELTAAHLEKVLGGSSTFWLAREHQYRTDTKRLSGGDRADVLSSWLSEIPLREMIRYRWVSEAPTRLDQAKECLRFFGVPSVLTWRERYSKISDAVAFRTSRTYASNPGAVATWLRRGEIEASKIKCAEWDPTRLRVSLNHIRALTRIKPPSKFLPELRRLCASSGVALAIVRAPAGCKASGLTKFLSPTKALILLSFRYKSDDHFWFSFFHECGHLLLHGERALFIEAADMLSTAEEEEANTFAANALVPRDHQEEMKSLDKNYRSIMRFARRIGVSPGIVVGQMQHMGLLARKHSNFLKVRYEWS